MQALTHPSRLTILLALLALLLPTVSLANPQPAHAAALVNCSGGTGDFDLDPAITTTPTNVAVEVRNNVDFSDCSDPISGITDARYDGSGQLVLAVCTPLLGSIDLYAAAEAFGTLTISWTGGSGAPTTSFNWTVVGALQIGPETSVIELSGNSFSGRFHDGTPALLTLNATVTNPRPRCIERTTAFTVENISFQVIDVL